MKWRDWSNLAPYEPRAAVHDAWADWVAGMGEWHVFGGLTYDQRRLAHPLTDRRARSDVRRWLRDIPRKTDFTVEAAVVALEYHKSGAPHFHPLVRLAGGEQPRMLAQLGQLWYQRHGYAKLEIPRSQLDVASYASKYLTKDLARGDIILWPPRGPLTTHQPALGSQT